LTVEHMGEGAPSVAQSPVGDEAAATERAILAGGCFWGVEDLLRRARGVLSTRVGYTGGEMPDPTYARHYGHAEAVEVTFDPSILSYRSLLELFFQIHDPTTYEQQGSDVGPSYRSAIFYTSDVQKEVALATIAEIEASGRWPGPVLSEINPEEIFWEAEPEHQKYLARDPLGYSCHFARPTWRLDGSGR
jgi:peptide-methionine (S)-S-oxide reductase